MNIKDETTQLVQTLKTLDSAEQNAFLEKNLARFAAILSDHTRGPLDDPDNPDAPVDATVDPRNIYFTVLMLDKDTLLGNLDGKFASFINAKWVMALDIFVKLLPLGSSAAELREQLSGVRLTDMLATLPADQGAYADDLALIRNTLIDMFADTSRKQTYLAQFAKLL